ncbi:hypothetical protein [Geobacter toluenoxydans]
MQQLPLAFAAILQAALYKPRCHLRAAAEEKVLGEVFRGGLQGRSSGEVFTGSSGSSGSSGEVFTGSSGSSGVFRDAVGVFSGVFRDAVYLLTNSMSQGDLVNK